MVVNDFGLAESQAPLESVDATLTLTPYRGGALLYMAPEQFDGGVPLTPRADVYSFGLIAYEILAGCRSNRPAAPPPPLRDAVPEIPAEWDRMAARCLATKPQDRFATCGEAIASVTGASQPRLSPIERWVPASAPCGGATADRSRVGGGGLPDCDMGSAAIGRGAGLVSGWR